MQRRKRNPDRVSVWSRGGLTERQESVFKILSTAFLLLMGAGWTYAVYDQVTHTAVFNGEKFKNGKVVQVVSASQLSAAPVSGALSEALSNGNGQGTAFLTDAALSFLTPLHGQSGKLHVAMRTPGQVVADEGDPHMQARFSAGGGEMVSPDFTAPDKPGIYDVAVELNQASRRLDDLRLITLVPFQEKKNGRIGSYLLGSWPSESGPTPKSSAYANPSGFIEVTPQNRDLPVSDHFHLGDFLTKDQPNVWPKYLLLQPRLLDKLELVIAELEAEGIPVKHVQVMSGFRTPRYNVSGGNTGGRAGLSRHMYGDASDIFLDNNRDGATDDINGDGHVDVKVSEFMAAIAERVERKYPALVGGIGVYPACCGHGPFTHIDVRGYRARWRGSGNG